MDRSRALGRRNPGLLLLEETPVSPVVVLQVHRFVRMVRVVMDRDGNGGDEGDRRQDDAEGAGMA